MVGQRSADVCHCGPDRNRRTSLHGCESARERCVAIAIESCLIGWAQAWFWTDNRRSELP